MPVGSNFRIPDKPSNKSNHIIIEHIDEMLDILKEQANNEGEEKEEPESKLIYMIHTTDDLEAIVRRKLMEPFLSNRAALPLGNFSDS